jgi:HEAT repeat protein
MKTLSLLLSCSIAFSLVSVQPCLAHGGQYRGPGDVVPPGGGGPGAPGPSGPITPGPRGPGAPAPAGGIPAQPPATGGGANPPGGSAQPGRTGGRGIEVEPDLSRWEFWWEFNKDPFLRLKDAVHDGGPRTGEEEGWLGTGLRHDRVGTTLKPTDAQLVGQVLPALKKALDSSEQRDITTSCMIAMAKIGENHPSFRLVDEFRIRLRRKDQEVRETAALAIGIAGIAEEREVSLLISLVADDTTGREACDRAEVDERTRSFAAYGLGLLANHTSNLDLKRKALAGLRPLLDDVKAGSRDLQVAAIQSIGLLSIDSTTPAGNKLLQEAVQCLQRFYEAKLGPGQQLIQAHCPTAIAKLIGADPVLAAAWKERFAEELRNTNDSKRSSRDISRSCVIALGKLCGPDGEGADSAYPDRVYSQLLRNTYANHRDDQTRYFAAIALGEIGGKHNRDALLTMLRKGKKALEKPWCAVALGVYAFHDLASRQAGGVSAEPDSLIGTTLTDEFAASKVPELRAAIAIGLGLCRWTAGSDLLRESLRQESQQDELAGYLCIGLALMNERRATDDIQAIVEKAGRRPDLLKQSAIALGKLGDKSAADRLQRMLADSESNLARLAGLATALGFIGDQRSISPLLQMLFDRDLSELSRAFAAVALGGISDKEVLPWNSKIAVGSNYRAAVETLTDRSTGILDIL